jgi:hypothetical protein
MNTSQLEHFDAQALCSRKLLEVIDEHRVQRHTVALSAALRELLARKDYLHELQERGLIRRSDIH